MGNYLINNGPSWVNFCNCEINIKDHNNIWQYINPYQCEIKYWTGTKWCLFELNNIFNYATGQAPTLDDFATQIGFPLINCAKFGDTIVFDNVGYTLGFGSFNFAGLIGFLKCSASIVGDTAFFSNSITHVYCLSETIGFKSFQQNSITHVYLPNNLTILGNGLYTACFQDNNIQYFNAPVIQQIGETTGNNGIFNGNTGNNITAILPSIHRTSNGGNLEGDLQYLEDNNTVTFDWDGQEVPDWINACGTL